MTAATVADKICTYLGGPYDAATRTYRQTPQVITGIGTVRRAIAKRQDAADFHFGQTAPSQLGAVMVVYLPTGFDRRVAFPAVSGWKRSTHLVQMRVYVRAAVDYAEDCDDFTTGLLDAIKARLRADVTCASGGIESGGLQIGEGDLAEFSWRKSLPEVENELTRQYLELEVNASEYVQA